MKEMTTPSLMLLLAAVTQQFTCLDLKKTEYKGERILVKENITALLDLPFLLS